LVYRIHPENYVTRSPACHGCFRFKKNALKEKSALFRWLDGYFNPLFNRVRDSLLTPEELNEAREYALGPAASPDTTESSQENRK